MNIRKLNYLKIQEEFFYWRYMFEKLKSRTFKIDFAAPYQPKMGNFKALKYAIDTDE